jgi:hexosaminidase
MFAEDLPPAGTNSVHASYSLAMRWTPAMDAERPRYEITLTNHTDTPLKRFSLSFCGPARIDLKGLPLENAILLKRLSNYTEVMLPEGSELAPGASWTFTARGTQNPLRHWSDAAQYAYLTLSDGSCVPVTVGRCQSTAFPPGEPKLGYDDIGSAADIVSGLALVPWPSQVSVGGLREAGPLYPVAKSDGARAAVAAFARLTRRIFPAERFVATTPAGAIEVILAEPETSKTVEAEAYVIRFDGSVTLTAATTAGYLYGLITLGQILRGARLDPSHCRFPATGTITDQPRFGWRGSHIDVARQFYPLDELETFVAIMAWNKLNRLHLHLTEDEAWRYEVTAYPELTRVGAFRGVGLPLPPLLGSGIESYGGFYTKDDLRGLVTSALGFGIEIIPEVDVPGHCWAAIVALPQLRDPGENFEYRSIQGFPNNCLNSAVPATREFAETIFRELMELFPSKWIHIGADEVPDDAWTGSPLGRKRLEEIDSTQKTGNMAHDLQADFLRHLHAQIRTNGRITGAWEEGAHGDGVTPEGAYLVAWRSAAVGAKLAAAGYDVVMAPGQAYYLDMARTTDWWEPGATWAGVSSVENTYRFDPLEGFAPEDRHRMIGVQACIWSEPMSDRRVFRRLVFPRLSAIAETGWTPEAQRSYPRFAANARFLPYRPE